MEKDTVDEEKQNEKPVSTIPEATKDKGSPPPSRLNRITLRLLRLLLGILILMGLGAVLVIYTLYLPTRQKLIDSQEQVEQADQRVTELEGEVGGLSTFEEQNQDLLVELDKSRLQVAILSARADVSAAQLALALNNPAKARLALSKTPETLKKLESMLEPGKKKLAEDMQARLDLAVKEIGENAYAANSDLDVLATGLLELENAFFAKP